MPLGMALVSLALLSRPGWSDLADSDGELISASPSMIEYSRKQIDQGTHEVKDELDKLAAFQMAAFGKAMGVAPKELESPRIGKHGKFIVAITHSWIYRTDVAGNQTFRPVANLPHLAPRFERQSTPNFSGVSTSELTRATQALADVLANAPGIRFTETLIEKEVLLLGKCGGAQEVQSCDGRYLARMIAGDNRVYFQVLFDRALKPLRIDTSIKTESATRMAA